MKQIHLSLLGTSAHSGSPLDSQNALFPVNLELNLFWNNAIQTHLSSSEPLSRIIGNCAKTEPVFPNTAVPEVSRHYGLNCFPYFQAYVSSYGSGISSWIFRSFHTQDMPKLSPAFADTLAWSRLYHRLEESSHARHENLLVSVFPPWLLLTIVSLS